MKRFTGLKFLALAVVAGAMTMPAWAALEVSINGGAACIDNTACDSNAAVGSITTGAAVLGGITITGTADTSGSPVGTLSLTLNGSATATGSFTVALTDTGFTNPAPPNLTIKEVVGGTTGGVSGTVSSVGTFFAGTGVFVTSGAGTTQTGTASTTLGGAQGSSTSGVISTGNPYSLTEVVTISITALSTTNNTNFQVNADISTQAASSVPEPTSVLLLGSALLFSVTALKRKIGRS